MNTELYELAKAAELLGRSRERIRQLCISGELDFQRIGPMIVLTEKGMEQAREYFQNTRSGPKGPRKKS